MSWDRYHEFTDAEILERCLCAKKNGWAVRFDRGDDCNRARALCHRMGLTGLTVKLRHKTVQAPAKRIA